MKATENMVGFVEQGYKLQVRKMICRFMRADSQELVYIGTKFTQAPSRSWSPFPSSPSTTRRR